MRAVLVDAAVVTLLLCRCCDVCSCYFGNVVVTVASAAAAGAADVALLVVSI